MRIFAGALLVASSGCSAAAPAEPEAPVHHKGGCDPAPAQKLIGQARSEAAGAEALRASGAGTIRWLPEGAIVTMEYREDRLNIHLDARNRILRINCG